MSRKKTTQRERQSNRTKRNRKKGMIKTFIIVIAILVAVGVVLVWQVFTVDKLKISGNQIYNEKQIKSDIMAQEHSWSSLYLYVAYQIGRGEVPQYLKKVSVSMNSPHDLTINVKEKTIVCYVYSKSENKYVYLDENGYAMLISEDIIEGIPKLSGVNLGKIELYKRATEKEMSVFKFLASAEQLLEKNDLVPTSYYLQDDTNLVLNYGKIQINLGTNDYLNEKIVRATKLYDKVKKSKGTLHLETWTEETTDVYFRKKELIKIPKDEIE